jgi:hypothetical protein
VELLENLIAAENEGNHNWAPFVMKSFRQQMNLVKITDRHLTNFKGQNRWMCSCDKYR